MWQLTAAAPAGQQGMEPGLAAAVADGGLPAIGATCGFLAGFNAQNQSRDGAVTVLTWTPSTQSSASARMHQWSPEQDMELLGQVVYWFAWSLPIRKKPWLRQLLSQAQGRVLFIHLDGIAELISQRMQGREGHFMPPTLLPSQFATLEPLTDDELAAASFRLDISHSPGELVAAVVVALKISARPEPSEDRIHQRHLR